MIVQHLRDELLNAYKCAVFWVSNADHSQFLKNSREHLDWIIEVSENRYAFGVYN